MTQFRKTILLAFILSAGGAYLAYNMQSTANSVTDACSYLDPITVDIFALAIGIFLVVESFVDIHNHKASRVKNQIFRCLRMSIGTSILTIHIMQFLHK